MKKMIIFSDKPAQMMTYEEVRKEFLKTIGQAMRKANGKFVYNKVEEEDFLQILELELWKAYDQYDPETGYCFKTYLYPKLQKGVRDATYSKYSQKNQHNGILSMHAPVGEDDLKLEDMLTIEDDSMNGITYRELVDIVQKSVTPEEEETLRCMLNKKDFSVQVYATQEGISRQAANQRITKLRKKLQDVIRKEYLGA